MERQHTHSWSLRPTRRAALAGMGILVLLGNMDWAIVQLRNCFCTTAGDAPGILHFLVLWAFQALQAFVFDHRGLLGWLIQTVLSFGPLPSGLG
jgi:hypothetical protein